MLCLIILNPEKKNPDYLPLIFEETEAGAEQAARSHSPVDWMWAPLWGFRWSDSGGHILYTMYRLPGF